jgi:hypothetical protein
MAAPGRKLNFRPRPIDIFKKLEIIRSKKGLVFDDEVEKGLSQTAGADSDEEAVRSLASTYFTELNTLSVRACPWDTPGSVRPDSAELVTPYCPGHRAAIALCLTLPHGRTRRWSIESRSPRPSRPACASLPPLELVTGSPISRRVFMRAGSASGAGIHARHQSSRHPLPQLLRY